MKHLIVFLLMMSAAIPPAFAQTAPVSDDEILSAYKLCQLHPAAPPHNPMQPKYDPEWNDRCAAIDAAYAKTQAAKDTASAAQAKANDKAKLDALISRLPK